MSQARVAAAGNTFQRVALEVVVEHPEIAPHPDVLGILFVDSYNGMAGYAEFALAVVRADGVDEVVVDGLQVAVGLSFVASLSGLKECYLAECGCAFATEADGQRERGHVVVHKHGTGRELHAGHHLQLYLITREVVEQLFANPKGLLSIEAAHVRQAIDSRSELAFAVVERDAITVEGVAQTLAKGLLHFVGIHDSSHVGRVVVVEANLIEPLHTHARTLHGAAGEPEVARLLVVAGHGLARVADVEEGGRRGTLRNHDAIAFG